MTMTVQEIIEYYNEHYDKYAAARSLAKANKCAPKDIFELLQNEGIIGSNNNDTPTVPVSAEPQQSAPTKKPKWTAEECELLLKLRADGVKWRDVAAQLNRKEKAVQFKYYELIKAKKSHRATNKAATEPTHCTDAQSEPRLSTPPFFAEGTGMHRLYLEVTRIISDNCNNVVPDFTAIEEKNHKLSLIFSAGDKRYNLTLIQRNIIKEG